MFSIGINKQIEEKESETCFEFVNTLNGQLRSAQNFNRNANNGFVIVLNDATVNTIIVW